MDVQSIVYLAYSAVHKVAKYTGIIRPVRKLIGPVAGRMLFKVVANSGRPVMVQGQQMHLAAPGDYPPVAMTRDRYEPGTTALFRGLLRTGMVVIDVGAHVGYYSLLAASQVGPTGKIYSFEPAPSNYELLLKNIELNGFHNVVAARKAVSNQVGQSTLYLTALDNGRHSIYRHDLPETGSAVVETTTIDDLLDGDNWPRVDLVKVDVEGAEKDVLDGMATLFAKQEPLTLILEFNPRLLQGAGVDPAEFLQRPNSWGFEVQIIDEDEGIVPLGAVDLLALTTRLSASETSVNLFCSRQ